MGTGVAVGLVLLMVERPDDGAKPAWADIAVMARRGEDFGADTVWCRTRSFGETRNGQAPEGGGTV